jgi:hypothetical protein
MQSDRFTILVGLNEEPFKVPQGLLIQCSLFFKKACSLPFKEAAERVIKLPDDKPSIFKAFFVWLHAYETRIKPDSDVESLIDLAIFAEKYDIHHLRNQTSDVIRTLLSEDRWKLTPEVVRMIYDGVPACSILRRLCSLGFAVSFSKVNTWGDPTRHDDYHKWKTIFHEFSDLGWDYFQRMQEGNTKSANMNSGGACRFHNHSDIFGWVQEDVKDCVHPDGAPVMVSEYEVVSVPKCDPEPVPEESYEPVWEEELHVVDKAAIGTEVVVEEAVTDPNLSNDLVETSPVLGGNDGF